MNFRPWADSKEYEFLKYLNLGGSVDYGNQQNPAIPQDFRTSANTSTTPRSAGSRRPSWS